MAGSASVGGLVSGLDTATIISQLMQVEAISQTRIKSRMATEQSNVKSLQDLNSKLAALATSAEKLAKPAAWNPVTVTSSEPLVSVTGGASAVTGSVSFTVGQLARPHSLTAQNLHALTDVLTTGDPTGLQLVTADGVVPIDAGDGSLEGLIKGLNASGTGVQASTVKVGEGYRLQVTSTKTGAAASFTLKNSDGVTDVLGGATVVDGADATITVGPDTVSSPTNSFTGIVNGLDITLKAGVKEGTVVNVGVTQDTGAMTASVKGLVDAVNAALADIDKLTSYNATTKTSGVLAGDGAVRSVRNALFSTVYPADGSSMAGLGIQTDRYGKLVFDEATFKKEYAANPAAVAAGFTKAAADGFAVRVQAIAKSASDSVEGTVTTAINGRTAGIDRMQDSIEAWDNRLALRRTTLSRQFAGLESALNRMNSQSSWLAGQLSALNRSS